MNDEINKPKILDSGNRREFDTGAVRDIAEGKGRCDLLPLDVCGEMYKYCWKKELLNKPGDYRLYVSTMMSNQKNKISPLSLLNFGSRYLIAEDISNKIDTFIKQGHTESIKEALIVFMASNNWTCTDMMLTVSIHYADGAKKYEERNWEKGIPLHCFIDSGLRHLFKWADDWNDEPHDRAFVWNMLGAMWTYTNKPELNDLPFHLEEDINND